MDYKCAKCGERLSSIAGNGLQCSKCGYTIFVKERPNITKELRSD